MDIVDLYCGIGGFSAGAMEAGCKPIAGYDCDDSALRLWSGNTGGKGVVTTLWKGRVRLPGPRANLHIHLSPPCTELSSAKRGASSETVIDDGKDGIRQALQVVLDYKYTSWSLENVSTPTVLVTRRVCAQSARSSRVHNRRRGRPRSTHHEASFDSGPSRDDPTTSRDPGPSSFSGGCLCSRSCKPPRAVH
jgi:hypothetical protein